MRETFKDARNPELSLYGTEGNQHGKTLVGFPDVDAINEMLQSAFDNGITANPAAIVKIGEYINIGEYKGRSVFEQKAADQIRISLDNTGKAYVKLIIRKGDPGLGLLASAGGFKDSLETDEETADREEKEEAHGKTGDPIKKYMIERHPVKGDVRVWSSEDRPDGVKRGDIITMTTVAIIRVVYNAHGIVEAGDDATSAGWVALSDLENAGLFGIKGHAEMLLKATELAGLSQQLPQSFKETLENRTQDIIVGDAATMKEALQIINAKGSSAQPQPQPQPRSNPRP